MMQLQLTSPYDKGLSTTVTFASNLSLHHLNQ